ncbi:MAG: 2,5-diamino-6-(ribosylamino)-4(3H)-pyrimidinone 5'-phosphate reductase [Thermoplasmata archaeon]
MQRPKVIINCAMSADGKIALPTRIQTRISCEEDMARVHRLRNNCDAVLVGIGTILADDPKLTVKNEYVKNPRQPLRVILDSKCRIPKNAQVLNGKAQTIIFTATGHYKKIRNAEVIECGENKIYLKKCLSILHRKGVKTLLVEGGETVIWSFLKERLVDELYVYVGSMIIGGKTSPTMAGGEGIKKLEEAVKLRLKKATRIGDGMLLQYIVIK